MDGQMEQAVPSAVVLFVNIILPSFAGAGAKAKSSITQECASAVKTHMNTENGMLPIATGLLE
jgi:hypothetical protein